MGPDIRNTFDRCRKRYPRVDLPLADYAARLQQVLREPHASGIHEEDLFLAMGCARGDRGAWDHFAGEFLPALKRFALQACRNPDQAEDLAQELVRNLMADGRKLAGFDGRGSLLAWLRVAVARSAIDRFRQGRRNVSLEEVAEAGGAVQGEGLSVPADAGRQLDERWGRILSELLAAEIRGLPGRDRLLLGLYYVENVPLHGIAAQFGVHESTVSRWLEGLRNGLRKRVEREFRVRHGLGPREVEGLWELSARAPELWLQESLGSPGAAGVSDSGKIVQDGTV